MALRLPLLQLVCPISSKRILQIKSAILMMLIQSLMVIFMFKKDILVSKIWSKHQLVRYKNAKIFVTMILCAKHLSSTYSMKDTR